MRLLFFPAVLGLSACQAAPPPTHPTSASESATGNEEGEGMGGSWDPSPVAAHKAQITEPMPMPAACAEGAAPAADAGADGVCPVDDAFVKKLCGGAHPDMAL